MKEFWHEFCIQAYVQRFSAIALALVIAVWFVLAELVIPRSALDIIVYCAFGWFVLGKEVIPWVDKKLTKLFS
jgi:hypothetical protein